MYVLAEVWGQDYTSLRMYTHTSKAHRYAVVMLEYQNLIFFYSDMAPNATGIHELDHQRILAS